ncbi:hypothetical protein [uncultured Gammaproteobacteria bacterium]|nr:hypothetical protein [uncultured Gammaproteobacteria bacterium]
MKKPDQLRKQAREQHLSGNTKDAIILLTEAISSDPSNVLVALDMVQIFLDINELEQAEALFNRLPDSAQKSEMGVSIASQLNFKQLAQNTAGIAVLQAQVLKSPDNYQANFDLALCLFAQHEVEQGMEKLFFIQENNPDFKEGAAKEMIGLICNMLANTNPKESGVYRRRLANLN